MSARIQEEHSDPFTDKAKSHRRIFKSRIRREIRS
jgi:hypothetical protein